MMRTLLLASALLLILPPAAALGRRSAPPIAQLPQADVVVTTSAGDRHRYRAWVAATDAARERGLMHVDALPADRGMLFLFERPRYAAFWMKDTRIPLDILFIAADGRITDIAAMTVPHSLQPLESSAPVVAVLELAGGTAEQAGIAVGDQVSYTPPR